MVSRILRVLAGLVLILPGLYLILISLLVGCVNIGQAADDRPALAFFWFWSGAPTSLAEWVIGVIGIGLTGAGYAVATSGRT
jgi:hypothetical protein